ncbi:hypothetical protein PIROE2DRAFT_18676 [Piromyces sp. E2]|nr:hypothetical protein PIROE2DRAFT_18676 [Piromyces sp. E2]|eukprot:OUM56621.1 hypothetical protein PIROE2DRAFT_18676 [Piromyces sp. E2]
MSCMSNCYIENEISKENQSIKEVTEKEEKEINSNEMDDSKLNKRASCPAIEKIRDYKTEDLVVPMYKSSKSDVRTRIDGCSSKVLNDLASYFTPACNGHDACYHCLSKTQCDNDFYDNMQYICEKLFPGFWNVIDYAQCKIYKNTAYGTVKVLSPKAAGHAGDREWKNDCKCTNEIKNKLVSKLFELSN